MTLTGPEGMVLDADNYHFANHFELRDENRNEGYWGGGVDSRDNDPNDNIVPLLLELRPPVGTTDIPKLTEHTWTLRLEDLHAFHWVDLKTADADLELLAPGVWEFEITFAEDTTVIEIIEEPVPCPAEVMQWPEWGDEEILITSLKLRALSGEMTFHFPEKAEAVNAWIDDIFLVMQDGNQVLMQEAGGWPDNVTFTFAAPIALEEVSHILLPNGTKIPMP